MAPIDDAIDYLRSQEVINYTATAKLFNIDRTTLSRRWRGVTSLTATTTDYKSLLTKQQQQTLVAYINKLTLRGIPPTQAMVRVFARDISSKEPGKN